MEFRIAFFILVGVWALGVSSRSPLGAQSPTSVNEGVYTGEQAKRGADSYTQECSSCHGGDMAGDGFAPPLAGSDFAANWNDLTVGDLYERIRISMPPDNPAKVTPQAKTDIIAYVLEANKYPAGTAELEAKAEVLKQIKIEMKK